ncbi:hypothetical protein KR032_000237, partial [Drosophila birchii]
RSSASGVPATTFNAAPKKSKLLATLWWMLNESIKSFCMCDWGNMLIMPPVSSTTRL